MLSFRQALRFLQIATIAIALSTITWQDRALAVRVDEVALHLEAPSGEINNFDLGLLLDALFQPFRTVAGAGSINFNGALNVAIAWNNDGSALPDVNGLTIRKSPSTVQGLPTFLSPSNLSTNFGVPTGAVNLATNSVVGYLESKPGRPMAEVEGGEFNRQDFRLVLMGGSAMVSVPTPKPGKGQDISEKNIVGEFLSPDSHAGRLELVQLSGSQYQVTLGIPMSGLSMTIANAGLPVDVTFKSGELRATGVLTVPEPAGTTLAAVALIALSDVRRRVRAARQMKLP